MFSDTMHAIHKKSFVYAAKILTRKLEMKELLQLADQEIMGTIFSFSLRRLFFLLIVKFYTTRSAFYLLK